MAFDPHAVPKGIHQSDWVTIEPFVASVLSDYYRDSHEHDRYKIATQSVLAHYTLWAKDVADIDVTAATLFTPDTVSKYASYVKTMATIVQARKVVHELTKVAAFFDPTFNADDPRLVQFTPAGFDFSSCLGGFWKHARRQSDVRPAVHRNGHASSQGLGE